MNTNNFYALCALIGLFGIIISALLSFSDFILWCSVFLFAESMGFGLYFEEKSDEKKR